MESRGARIDDTPEGTTKGEPYLSYLLRLWRVSDEEEPVWRASLKSAHSGERLGFAGLEDLFDYLRAETGARDEDVPMQAADDDGR